MTPPLDTTDLISKLPPEIIHGILRRLGSPEQAARTSVLSRTWHRQIWRSYPVIEYRDSEQLSGSTFPSFVSSSSKRISTYFIPNRIPLSAFRISLRKVDRYRQLDKLLESSSSLAAICGSPLEISVEIHSGYYGILLKTAFSNCSRTRILNLSRCIVYGFPGEFFVYFRNLESLNLLEAILFNNVGRLEIPFVSHLKSLKIERMFTRVNEIKLTSAPLLQTLELRFHCKLKIELSSSSAAPNLKFVTISDHEEVEQQDIDDLTSNLPSLEYLCFENSKFASGECWLRASDSKLTEFSLTNCSLAPLEIKIDAPNLATLVYKQRDFEPPLRDVSVINVASDFQFTVVVVKTEGSSVRWRELLAPFMIQLHKVRLMLQ
ncbi:hypothetical protein LINPERPRIM_LOCUS31832 [Linum perenne]